MIMGLFAGTVTEAPAVVTLDSSQFVPLIIAAGLALIAITILAIQTFR